MSSPARRVYEPARLADREAQAEVAGILTIPTDALTNVDPVPEPGHRVGAGGVRRFAPSPNWRDERASDASGRTQPRPTVQDEDIEMQSLDAADERVGSVRPQVGDRPQGPPQGEATTPRHHATRPQNPTGGYASLSSFMASDKVFTIFRRFDVISIRSLLYLQDELTELEETLYELDQTDMNDGTPFDLWRLHSRRGDNNAERNEILVEIREKLKEYRKQLLGHAQLLALGKPSEDYITSLSNWMDGIKPVVEEESHFLEGQEDLAPLGGQDHGNQMLENYVRQYWSRLFETKKHKSRPHSRYQPEVTFYSTTTIRRFVRAILTLFAVAIVIGPAFALSYVQSQVLQLGLIGVFALIFALALSLWTDSRNHELFAIMAGYCAVLVVFIRSNSTGA